MNPKELFWRLIDQAIADLGFRGTIREMHIGTRTRRDIGEAVLTAAGYEDLEAEVERLEAQVQTWKWSYDEAQEHLDEAEVEIASLRERLDKAEGLLEALWTANEVALLHPGSGLWKDVATFLREQENADG